MEVAVSAARWVVGKALAPVTHGVLEAWAASAGLGPNVDALKTQLLYARALLDNAHEREIRSPALKELLHKLRQQAYDADDVLDELEYFRIQDELDGTYHAADVHAGGGCVHGLALNARHTARAVAAKLKPSSTSRGTIRGATSTARSTTAQAIVIQSMPKECIPSSLRKLDINGCPAIRSLPNVEDLPSSLRELDVYWSESEELRRQCRKLIGIIPIVSA